MILYYVIAALTGLVVGSTLNVFIERLPKDEPVIKDFGKCHRCGKRLKPADYISFIGYLTNKGKTRCCGSGISLQYPVVELAAAAVFVLLFIKYELTLEFFAAAYLMTVLIAVFFIDLRHRIIPNELVLAGLAGAIVPVAFNIFSTTGIFGENQWLARIFGLLPGSGLLLFTAVIGIIIYKTDDVMGMGDVKIFAPIGIFLGWKLCTVALLLSIAGAGIISLVLMLAKIKKRKDAIPFGPFIVTGTFISLMWGQEIIRWYLS